MHMTLSTCARHACGTERGGAARLRVDEDLEASRGCNKYLYVHYCLFLTKTKAHHSVFKCNKQCERF